MCKTSIIHNKLLNKYLAEKKLLDDYRKDAINKKIPVVDNQVARFIEVFCMLKKAKNILEIGCGCGYSSYFLIKNLGRGQYTGIDRNEDRLLRAGEFLNGIYGQKTMHFRHGDALQIIPTLEEKFDLVFIDGAKYQYPDYLKSLMGKVGRNGFILADNVFYGGRVFRPACSRHHQNSLSGISEYLNLVSNHNNFRTRLYDIGDGISVSEVWL
ncbi:MAG: methyltransferase domain-containing protein [Actinomycetota bacterium]|nr:methyltransferase domain-containing protein [Actinomycetota bacterium]